MRWRRLSPAVRAALGLLALALVLLLADAAASATGQRWPLRLRTM